jgi:hypothetical protein
MHLGVPPSAPIRSRIHELHLQTSAAGTPARETLDCLDRTFHRDELVHGPGGDLARAARDARHPELLVALPGAVERAAGGLA